MQKGTSAPRPAPPEAVEAAQDSGAIGTAAGQSGGDGDMLFDMDGHLLIVLFIRTKCLPSLIGQIRFVAGQRRLRTSELERIGFAHGYGIAKAYRLKDSINIVITIGTTVSYGQGQINFPISFFYYIHHTFTPCIKCALSY